MARSSRPLFSITYGTRIDMVRSFGEISRLLLFALFLGGLVEDFVDDAVLFRLGGAQIPVAFGVARDHVERLTGVVGEDLVERLARLEDLLRLNLDIRDLAPHLAVG